MVRRRRVPKVGCLRHPQIELTNQIRVIFVWIFGFLGAFDDETYMLEWMVHTFSLREALSSRGVTVVWSRTISGSRFCGVGLTILRILYAWIFGLLVLRNGSEAECT